MANRKTLERVESYLRLLRGFGFVAMHNHSGWVAIHPNGHLVVGNIKRMKWERLTMTEGTPVVVVQKGPDDISWLNARLEEHGL